MGAGGVDRFEGGHDGAAGVGLAEWSSIIVADSSVAVGLMVPVPAMSGAVPWAGSK
jgi:hypothetical protein